MSDQSALGRREYDGMIGTVLAQVSEHLDKLHRGVADLRTKGEDADRAKIEMVKESAKQTTLLEGLRIDLDRRLGGLETDFRQLKERQAEMELKNARRDGVISFIAWVVPITTAVLSLGANVLVRVFLP